MTLRIIWFYTAGFMDFFCVHSFLNELYLSILEYRFHETHGGKIRQFYNLKYLNMKKSPACPDTIYSHHTILVCTKPFPYPFAGKAIKPSLYLPESLQAVQPWLNLLCTLEMM